MLENNQIGTYLLDQNAFIEQGIFEQKYPSLNWTDLIGVDTGADEWADVIVKRTIDATGEPKWTDSKGNIIPRVEVGTGITTHPIYQMELGYDWSQGEIARSMKAGIPLASERAKMVGKAFEEKLNSVAKFGDLEKKWTGLYNNAIVNVETATKTIEEMIGELSMTNGPQEIITWFQDFINQVYVDQTNTTYKPNLIILPVRDLLLLKSAVIPGSGTQTLLPFIESNLGVTFKSDLFLTAGVTNKNGLSFGLAKDRMVVVTKDTDVAKFHLPMPMRFNAPYSNDQKNWNVDGMIRTGGTEIRIPDAMLYVNLANVVG